MKRLYGAALLAILVVLGWVCRRAWTVDERVPRSDHFYALVYDPPGRHGPNPTWTFLFSYPGLVSVLLVQAAAIMVGQHLHRVTDPKIVRLGYLSAGASAVLLLPAIRRIEDAASAFSTG